MTFIFLFLQYINKFTRKSMKYSLPKFLVSLVWAKIQFPWLYFQRHLIRSWVNMTCINSFLICFFNYKAEHTCRVALFMWTYLPWYKNVLSYSRKLLNLGWFSVNCMFPPRSWYGLLTTFWIISILLKFCFQTYVCMVRHNYSFIVSFIERLWFINIFVSNNVFFVNNIVSVSLAFFSKCLIGLFRSLCC